MLFRSVLLGFILLFSLKTKAHSPDLSSAMLVHQGDDWILQIRAALTAFEYEVHYHFGQDSYKTPEEFQDLVFQHVQDNLSIIFNRTTEVELEKGKVQLGHETYATFLVKNIPDKFEHIQFKNSSFKNIHRNQSTLLIYTDGIDKEQFVLDKKNNHTAELKLEGSKFIMMNKIVDESNSKITNSKVKSVLNPKAAILIGIGLLTVVSIFLFKIVSRSEDAA